MRCMLYRALHLHVSCHEYRSFYIGGKAKNAVDVELCSEYKNMKNSMLPVGFL